MLVPGPLRSGGHASRNSLAAAQTETGKVHFVTGFELLDFPVTSTVAATAFWGHVQAVVQACLPYLLTSLKYVALMLGPLLLVVLALQLIEGVMTLAWRKLAPRPLVRAGVVLLGLALCPLVGIAVRRCAAPALAALRARYGEEYKLIFGLLGAYALLLVVCIPLFILKGIGEAVNPRSRSPVASHRQRTGEGCPRCEGTGRLTVWDVEMDSWHPTRGINGPGREVGRTFAGYVSCPDCDGTGRC